MQGAPRPGGARGCRMPGAGRTGLIAQFPAPPAACGQSCRQGWHGWAQAAPLSGPAPHPVRPLGCQYLLYAGCGHTVAGRAVPRAPGRPPGCRGLLYAGCGPHGADRAVPRAPEGARPWRVSAPPCGPPVGRGGKWVPTGHADQRGGCRVEDRQARRVGHGGRCSAARAHREVAAAAVRAGHSRRAGPGARRGGPGGRRRGGGPGRRALGRRRSPGVRHGRGARRAEPARGAAHRPGADRRRTVHPARRGRGGAHLPRRAPLDGLALRSARRAGHRRRLPGGRLRARPAARLRRLAAAGSGPADTRVLRGRGPARARPGTRPCAGGSVTSCATPRPGSAGRARARRSPPPAPSSSSAGCAGPRPGGTARSRSGCCPPPTCAGRSTGWPPSPPPNAPGCPASPRPVRRRAWRARWWRTPR